MSTVIESVRRVLRDELAELRAQLAQSTRAVDGYLGDGSDGTVVLDGVATPAFATRTGSTYTLTRDVYAGATLTVNAGVTLNPNGFRVFVRGDLIVYGTVILPGGNATGVTGGVTLAGGTLGTGGNGANGSTGIGVASAQVTNAIGGRGGRGGTASSGTAPTAGAATTPVVNNGGVTQAAALPQSITGRTIAGNALNGGSGGSSGSGDGTNAGGAGGAGTGVIVIAARRIFNFGTITAPGGSGAAGLGGNAAGGGGGAGGAVLLTFAVYVAGPGAVLSAPGGTGGAGVGTGTAGTAGAAGAVYTVQV